MLLKGRTAIITGAAKARGLGLATAHLFAEHDAKVAVLDLDAELAREAAKSLKGRGHIGIKCDVAKQRDCEKAVERALKRFGHIDVLVNNAGVNSPARFMEIDKKEYDRVFDVNLRGAFQMCQSVVPHMRERKSGSIVNVASVAGQRGGGYSAGRTIRRQKPA